MGNDAPSFNVSPQSADDVFIGETMEPLAVYAFMPKAAYDGEPLGNLRYPAMKGGIKADDLTESRVMLGDCINALDLTG
jgi:hypothetical protein